MYVDQSFWYFVTIFSPRLPPIFPNFSRALVAIKRRIVFVFLILLESHRTIRIAIVESISEVFVGVAYIFPS